MFWPSIVLLAIAIPLLIWARWRADQAGASTISAPLELEVLILRKWTRRGGLKTIPGSNSMTFTTEFFVDTSHGTAALGNSLDDGPNSGHCLWIAFQEGNTYRVIARTYLRGFLAGRALRIERVLGLVR